MLVVNNALHYNCNVWMFSAPGACKRQSLKAADSMPRNWQSTSSNNKQVMVIKTVGEDLPAYVIMLPWCHGYRYLLVPCRSRTFRWCSVCFFKNTIFYKDTQISGCSDEKEGYSDCDLPGLYIDPSKFSFNSQRTYEAPCRWALFTGKVCMGTVSPHRVSWSTKQLCDNDHSPTRTQGNQSDDRVQLYTQQGGYLVDRTFSLPSSMIPVVEVAPLHYHVLQRLKKGTLLLEGYDCRV